MCEILDFYVLEVAALKIRVGGRPDYDGVPAAETARRLKAQGFTIAGMRRCVGAARIGRGASAL